MRTSTAALFCVSLFLPGCATRLQEGLSNDEATTIIGALAEEGIAAQDVNEGGDRHRIEVREEDAARARGVLQMRELPRRDPRQNESSSFFPHPREQAERALRQRARTIESSLELLDGVLLARVVLSERRVGSVDGQNEGPRASVVLRARPNSRVTEQGVAQLVANAHPGLESAAVRVQLERVELRPAPVPLAPLGPFSVAKSSQPLLKAIVATSFGLNVLLIALIVSSRVMARAKN